MKRTNFSIREDQIERLKKHYETTGIRMSEIVRRAIDLYFEREESDKNERLSDYDTFLA